MSVSARLIAFLAVSLSRFRLLLVCESGDVTLEGVMNSTNRWLRNQFPINSRIGVSKGIRTCCRVAIPARSLFCVSQERLRRVVYPLATPFVLRIWSKLAYSGLSPKSSARLDPNDYSCPTKIFVMYICIQALKDTTENNCWREVLKLASEICFFFSSGHSQNSRRSPEVFAGQFKI
ncbi:hypothetical protein IW262DRAFT_376608 [Armillaria fumosa]|nr:hypothetical protein IW262DRAFT_376608 [Armillaria fumosa]